MIISAAYVMGCVKAVDTSSESCWVQRAVTRGAATWPECSTVKGLQLLQILLQTAETV